ncbi:C-signal-like [Clytia hemisphaerica]|uniref:C-factor n=2 Tax=Clytia hemisphaerica TaxID=252671 RepID=A0A7M5UE68_9CNID
MLPSVLVTGCNKGIGLEFIKQLVGKTSHLFATCRTPSNELSKLAEENSNLHILHVEVTKDDDIFAAKEQVSHFVEDGGLHCLINNAGVVNYEHAKMENLTSESLLNTYHINAVGPAMMVKAFLPLLRQAATNSSSTAMPCGVLNISSRTGSIEDNGMGKLYGSRLSKVALNMLTKNLSIELKADNLIAVALNPGWVKTENGGENALITAEQSVHGMLSVYKGLTMKDSGAFLSYDGSTIPW